MLSFAAQSWLALSIDSVPLILLLLVNRAADLVGELKRKGHQLYESTIAAVHWSTMMRQLVDQTFDAVFMVDGRGRLTMFNPGAARMFGYAADEVIGETVTMLLQHDADEDAGIEVTAANTPTVIGARRRDGTAFPLEVTVTPVMSRLRSVGGENGQTTHIVVARDLTVIQQTHDNLERARLAAEAASRAKTEFLAAMGHELRTPLNAIIGFSTMMHAQMFGPLGHERYLQYTGDISDSGTHLLSIVNDILDVAKAEAGKLELHEDPGDLAKLVSDALRMVELRAQDAKVALSVTMADDLPQIQADQQKLKQVLLNLLSNAIKFTPEGGRVSVGVAWQPATGFTMVVSDDGIGMNEADIPLALEPFTQLDSRLSRKYEGTGLGLPLASRIIALHGGEFRITSAPEAGTTVTVILPASRAIFPAEPALRSARS
jgi:PAS domain S-box-containing protein